MRKKWIIPASATERETLAKTWSVPPVVAQILFNRGLPTDRPCEGFLSPQLRDLHPPDALPGVPSAARRIADAIREKRRIILYGDYDVDGTTGVAILWHVIRLAGGTVDFYVPHRIEEGYGVNLEAVQRLAHQGAELIVTVDCGITAVEAAKILNERGIPFIITDHHAPHDPLPDATVIVHPSAVGLYPNPHLSGAGVAFKLAWETAKQVCGTERLPREFRDLLMEMLPLAALGTIADVVPLVGENRIIARHGLHSLPETRLPGLKALIESAGLARVTIGCYDVGFKLAPRINAAGRMGHARLAVELLTRADAARSREIAIYLEEHNRSRQSVERKTVRQACEMVDRDGLAGDARRAIVLAAEGWHAGVIGIVASRLVARYHRPAVMIALSNGEGQGSGRATRHFDLAAALAECGELLLAHGGHAAAAGLRIATERLAEFTDAFVRLANNRLTADDLTPRLRIDAEVSIGELTLSTTQAILGLGPFGAGNPRPLLATDWVDLASEPRCVGSRGDHLSATFRQNGSQVRGIGFGLAGELQDLMQHRRCRVAFEPIVNDFNGRRSVEMQIVDFQFPD